MDQAQASVACPELFLISLAQTSLAHENEKAQLLSQWALSFSDPDRIQTCNPQSRNLIFYSVELRGLSKQM